MIQNILSFDKIFVILLIFSILHVFRIVTSDQVVLMDTDVTQWMNWTSNTGWRQQSLPNTAKRVYGVCRLKDLTNDHWLRSPFVPRGAGVSLHIELHFTIRECRNYPNPTELRHCGDTLGLYYRETLSAEFRKETVVAPDRKWLDSSDKGNHMNIRTIKIKPSGPGIYIALRDTGSCVAVYRVRIYHQLCPDRLVNFTRFPATPAGHLYDVIDVPGRCVEGAELAKEKISLSFCKADGTWHDANRAWCQCKAGYEPSGISCSACKIGKYKSTSGLSACVSCPKYSSAKVSGSVICGCDIGYFRNPGLDSGSMMCTRPPSAPQTVKILKRTDVAVSIAWTQPADLGGRDDLQYYVTCVNCPPGAIFIPSHRFPQTNISITHLTPNSAYRFTIYAVNGVSDLLSSNDKSSTSVDLHTEPRLSKKIERLQVDLLTATIILASWRAPAFFSGSDHKYELRFCSHGETNDCNLYYSNTESYRVTNLTPDTAYSLQVRVLSASGIGEYSDVVMVKTLPTGENTLAQQGAWSAEHVVYVVIPLIIVCVCFIVIAACIVNRRRSDTSTGRESVTPYSNIIFSPSVEATKCYIDPNTYEDLSDAVRDFTQEIDASWVTIDHVIGGGEFGDVCKGVLNLPGRYPEAVAVKTLKGDANEKSRADFLLEASIMGQFRHSHVIRLLGVVTKTRPALIVTEFMENGSLDKFLRLHRLSTLQRLEILRCIASGITYLAGMGFVHRDLAARNVLVDGQLCCKVSDFGMSRVLETDAGDEAYVTRGGKIPVRWTAPEAINFRKYTSASDVWSFGIVMWEIFSGGERPYWEWTNHEVIQSVNGGYRLPQPDRCPDTVYRMMMRCWDEERLSRPNFPALSSITEDLIDSEQRRKTLERTPALTLPLLCPYMEVELWLGVLGLDRYTRLMQSHGIYFLNNAFQLTGRSLLEMGVLSDNDRRLLLESIDSVRHLVGKIDTSNGCFV